MHNPSPFLIPIIILILSFEEFNNKFGIDNKAMSNIKIEDISQTPIKIIMRDETPETIYENNCNFIVNLHPTDGTQWVLVIRREGGHI